MNNLSCIPNTVHFVHPGPANETLPILEFQFSQFIAIYSAHYYLSPEKIYIHTNVKENLLGAALSASKNPYSRAIARLHNVIFKYQVAPTHSTSSLPIKALPHQSEFIRTRVLKEYGGIYLDHDSYVLKDLEPLRCSGFKTVVGTQIDGQIGNAVILATPKNELITAYDQLQDKLVDGSSEIHSLGLLKRLVQDSFIRPTQVLVLAQDSFFPLDWEPESLRKLYREDQGGFSTMNHDTQNITNYISTFDTKPQESMEIDWRSSYTMHGWSSSLKNHWETVFWQNNNGITLEYVLARKSNFAKALYPAVKHAVDTDVLENPNPKPELEK
ncbi:hypothetical protein MMC28_000932 [Mycoblastus sanguinarius]|nr:hypothetical protein [Mycoblastus sanguinarius]